MNKYLIRFFTVSFFAVLLFFTGGIASAQSWYDEAWSSRQEITIDSDNAAYGLSGNLTNFPYLIQLTDGANDIFGTAQSDGDDILFTASDGVTKLAHEIESYDDGGGTEELVAWVHIPTFVYNADTTIYMYYGNPNIENQEQPEQVWDDGYVGVWHMKEDGSTSEFQDSTRNDNTGVGGNITSNGAPTQSTTSISGYSQDFDGTDDQIIVGDAANPTLNFGTQSFTFGLWVNDAVTTGYHWFLWRGGHSAGTPGYSIYRRDTGEATICVGDNVDREKVSFFTTDNTWYYLVGVVDRTTQELRGYVNGVLEGEVWQKC
jgi:hypothetical protein